MERESFEDAETAALMNERFVCVKVDREERPDVDAIYMDAVQAMTGHGGWPLNVFLTPEQAPFYGGTYFPPERAHGDAELAPGARRRRRRVGHAARGDPRAGRQGRAAPGAAARCSTPVRAAARGSASLDDAVAALRQRLRQRQRRLGRRAEVPAGLGASSSCSARGEPPMALQTLRSMAGGGIYDQVGGGFSRYSVDARWTVPHFEKMLYDNALLARAYLHGWQASGDALLRRTAEETLDWALREMRAPEGGFYSALDADSEGVEGKFYVWTLDELREALGDDADAAIAWFGASERGNFEGANVLESRGRRAARRAARRGSARALLEVRAQRVRPGLDDKRLTAWNALDDRRAGRRRRGARPRGLPRRRARARRRSCSTRMRDADGRLLRTFNAGTARLGAYLEDHAFLLEALLVLYEATFEERWFVEARALADTIVARFGDPERGGFFSTADDHEALIARRKDLEDHADPVGRLERGARPAAPRGADRRARATRSRRAASSRCCTRSRVRHPQRLRHLLQALDLYLAPRREVALAGDPAGVAALAASSARRAGRTSCSPAAPATAPTAVALMEQRTPVDGRAAAYVCERFACRRRSPSPTSCARCYARTLSARGPSMVAIQIDWRGAARRRFGVGAERHPRARRPPPNRRPVTLKQRDDRLPQLRSSVERCQSTGR